MFRSQERGSILRGFDSTGSVFVAAEKASRQIHVGSDVDSTFCLGFAWKMYLPLECYAMCRHIPALILVTDPADPSFRHWCVIDLRRIIAGPSHRLLMSDTRFATEKDLMHFVQRLGACSSSCSSRNSSACSLDVDVFCTRLSGLTEQANRGWLTMSRCGDTSRGVLRVESDAAVRTFGCRHVNPRVSSSLAFSLKGELSNLLHPRMRILKTLEYIDGEPAEFFVVRLPPNLATGTLIYRLGGKRERSLYLTAQSMPLQDISFTNAGGVVISKDVVVVMANI